jgi:autotransporter-associated beta strand protein
MEIHANRGIAIGPASGAGAAEFLTYPNTTLTYNGVIANNGAGVGTLVKAGRPNTGEGELALGGVNTYTGGTLIQGGTVRLTNLLALGSAGTVTIATAGYNESGFPLTASLLVQATGSFARPVVVNATNFPNGSPHTGRVTVGTPDFAAAAETVFAGPITLNKATTLQGGNPVQTRFTGTISGTGDVTITAAAAGRKVVFDMTSANSFGNLTVAAGATLQLGSGAFGAFTANRQVPDTSTVTFASNTSALWLVGPSGGTTGNDHEAVNALVSSVAGAGLIKTTIAGNANGGYTLTVGAGNGSGTYSGIIGQDAGRPRLAVVKAGTGTQVFSGIGLLYTGGTTVNAGTLLANGQNAPFSGTGAGPVVVNNTGTLGGNGRIAGGVTVNPGGRITAGTGPANRILTLGSSLTIDGGRYRVVLFGSGNELASWVAAAGSVSLFNSPVLELDLDGQTVAGLRAGGPKQYTILTGSSVTPGGFAPPDFTALGFDPSEWSVSYPNGNSAVLHFTPVPEPAAVLGLAAAGLGLAGLARRKSRRAGAAAV